MKSFYLFVLAAILTVAMANLHFDFSESVKFIHTFDVEKFNRFTFLGELFSFLNNVEMGNDCQFHFNESDGKMLYRNITFMDTADHMLAKKQTQLRSSSNKIMSENNEFTFSGIGVQINNQLQQILINMLQHIHTQTSNQNTNNVHGDIKLKLEQRVYGWHTGSTNYFDLDLIMNNSSVNPLTDFDIYPTFKQDFNIDNNSSIHPVKTIYQWLWTDIKMMFGKKNTEASIIFTYDQFTDKTPSAIEFTWSVMQNNNTWNDNALKCSMMLLNKFKI